MGDVERDRERLSGQRGEVHVDAPEPEAGPSVGVGTLRRCGPGPAGVPSRVRREFCERRRALGHRTNISVGRGRCWELGRLPYRSGLGLAAPSCR